MSRTVPEDLIMIVALLAIALCSALTISGLSVSLGAPLWIALPLFSLSGSISLLLTASVIYGLRADKSAQEESTKDHAIA